MGTAHDPSCVPFFAQNWGQDLIKAARPWQRIESTRPVPLEVRTLEKGPAVVLEVTPRPGAYRGRFIGEIRLWKGEGKSARCLRIPCFGLVEK